MEFPSQLIKQTGYNKCYKNTLQLNSCGVNKAAKNLITPNALYIT